MRTWHVVIKANSGDPYEVELDAVSYSLVATTYVFVGSDGKQTGWFDKDHVVGIYFVN